jgi:hypothetical protein
MPLAAAVIPSGFMIMKPAPRKEIHEGSAVDRSLGGTLCPAEESTERGLSQSAENAILLAGAVTVAGIVITLITAYVRAKLPKL